MVVIQLDYLVFVHNDRLGQLADLIPYAENLDTISSTYHLKFLLGIIVLFELWTIRPERFGTVLFLLTVVSVCIFLLRFFSLAIPVDVMLKMWGSPEFVSLSYNFSWLVLPTVAGIPLVMV